ncbi:MAG: hypothetical protein DDG59_05830 [Anaerolineae bacterium]|jgi:hypothetical protein|nr:MAG: hypothetical protein DDG59_05830 [Anaerolineae bacterium]
MIASFFLVGAILAPLFSFALLALLRFRKARIGLQWLVSYLGAMFAWLCLFGLRFFLPHELAMWRWQPQNLFPLSPALLADGFSWPIGLILVSVGGAVLLTEATTQAEERVFGWAGNLLLVGLGLSAIFAGNQLTLLLAWAATDLVELAIWLSRPAQAQLRERVILAFSSRAFAVMLSLWGFGNPWAYVVSILLRWGVFPFHLPYLESPDLRRGLGTIIRIVPPLTTIPLLARFADLATFSSLEWIRLILGVIALLALIQWVLSADVFESRPFWIIGVASFAFYAAVLGRPEAVLAWGGVLAVCGSFLFLTQVRDRFWLLTFGFVVMLLLGLPFTPFWDLVRIYPRRWSMETLFWMLSHFLLIVGAGRFFLQKPKGAIEGEPWTQFLHRFALIGLIGSVLIVGYGGWRSVLETALSRPYTQGRSWLEYFIGFGLMGMSLLMALMLRWRSLPSLRLSERWRRWFSMEWLYGFLRWAFRQVGILYQQFEAVLEGRGGILWAIVFTFVLARVFLFFREGQ